MKKLTLCALSGALLALAACDSRQETAGQKVDRTITAAENAAKNLKQQGKEATSEMAQKVSDATITASVNADLAKDSELSALRINVDTHDGRVSLFGSAPSEEAKQRAERLAMAEKGVVSVDNKLAIEKR